MKKLTYNQMLEISEKVRIECKSIFPSYISVDTYTYLLKRASTYSKRCKDVTYIDEVCTMCMFSSERNDNVFVTFNKPNIFTAEQWAFILLANEIHYISYEQIKEIIRKFINQ